MSNDRLTKKVFLAEYEKQGKWCTAVKLLFELCGCAHVYYTKSECDLQWCKDKLTEIYWQEWKRAIKLKPKLRTYMKLKEEIGVEKYIQINRTKSQRSLLAQIRMGILPLHIETGRFSRKNVTERICTLCNKKKVEDELHFLFSCSYYKQERSDFFNSINVKGLTYSQAANFKLLCKLVPRKFSKYLAIIWQKRKDGLYSK